MNALAERAYLSHIIEPSDTHVGGLLSTEDPGAVIVKLWNDDAEDRAGRYRPRMLLGTDAKKIEDWYQDTLRRYQVTFITPEDTGRWPEALHDLGDTTPPGLWVRGDVAALASLNTHRSVSIVGARAATSYGEHVAHELASDLAARGYLTISGAAYGIDAAVHRASVAAGGKTIAFLAAGADRAYPAGHTELLQRVVQAGGAVVSEVPPGSTPTKWRFLARNRLIAAAGDATVVVEAGYRSGSLNTASHASSMMRPLGAVPGPITSPASAGCHRLIKDYAATPITGYQDVLALIGETP